MTDWGVDRSGLEAMSWRLASELVRRHPATLRMIRGHPGGGLSDVLWLLPLSGGGGDVRLNRHGTIQVLERFDGRDPLWRPVDWDEYLNADPYEFLLSLESGAGLPTPNEGPAATPRTLTLRILAAIAATAVKSVHPIEIQPGAIDTAGHGGGHNNDAFDSFHTIPQDLMAPQEDDLHGQPGYRFWFVLRDSVPILAFEQDRGVAWTPHHEDSVDLMHLYEQSRRHLLATTLTLLQRVDEV